MGEVSKLLRNLWGHWWAKAAAFVGGAIGLLGGYDVLCNQLGFPTIRAIYGMSHPLMAWWGWLCVLVAMACVVLIAQALNSGQWRRHKLLTFVAGFAVAVCVSGAWLSFEENVPPPHGPSTKPIADKYLKRPLTLLDLFNTDFKNVSGVMGYEFDSYPIRLPDGRTVGVRVRVIADYSSHTRFLSFFIPGDGNELATVFALPSQVRGVLARQEIETGHSGEGRLGTNHTDDWSEMSFSGAVYLYVGNPLSSHESAAADDAFRAEKLAVTVFDENYRYRFQNELREKPGYLHKGPAGTWTVPPENRAPSIPPTEPRTRLPTAPVPPPSSAPVPTAPSPDTASPTPVSTAPTDATQCSRPDFDIDFSDPFHMETNDDGAAVLLWFSVKVANKSGAYIKDLDGYAESELDGHRYPIYFRTPTPDLLEKNYLPKDTTGIPPGNDFDIVVTFDYHPTPQAPYRPINDFLKVVGGFTLSITRGAENCSYYYSPKFIAAGASATEEARRQEILLNRGIRPRGDDPKAAIPARP